MADDPDSVTVFRSRAWPDSYLAALDEVGAETLAVEQCGAKQGTAAHRQYGHFDFLPVLNDRGNVNAGFHVCIVGEVGVYFLKERQAEGGNGTRRQGQPPAKPVSTTHSMARSGRQTENHVDASL